ncbi:hypothetical protein H7I02_15760 [Mycolicibacterium brumae]|nr:hypothetical protein [Mycolicibacterium brumae]MCV7194233.1 hypothetical protein [Mycolicibacterium brumae]UWW10420.1 hypothetical protein L2Z93_003549 [Mycolicibacterium brumae]
MSMTPTTVRMVLVEGENADGVTVDHDVFAIPAGESAPAQVVAAILGTRESAVEGGHHLLSVGVTWRDHASAKELREALKSNGIDDVMLVSELHSAGALATAAGGAMGYENTGLMFLERDTATLSVVDNADGSIIKVERRELHTADAVAELGAMLRGLEDLKASPDGVFVVGAGVDVAAIKTELESSTSLAVVAPSEPELALARGAALASTQAPLFEATTSGMAFALADRTVAGSVVAAALAASTEPADGPALAYSAVDDADDAAFAAKLASEHDLDSGQLAEIAEALEVGEEAERKPFLLVGSTLATVFVVGIAALAISLAVTIRPTADERPAPTNQAIVPAEQLEKEPVVPAPETITAPEPAAQQAPAQQSAPHTVQANAPAPAPAAAPVQAPAPVVVEAPAAVEAPVVVPVQQPPAAVIETPAPAAPAPVTQAPAVVQPTPAPQRQQTYPAPQRQWEPSQNQQTTQYPQSNPMWPQQQYPSWPQQQYPSYPQQQYPSYPQQRQSESQYPSRKSDKSERRSSRDGILDIPFLPWPLGGDR